MRQFDAPKKKPNGGEDDDEDINAALQALADEIERIEVENERGEEDETETNNEEYEGREGMTDKEIRKLEKDVRPVCLVLTKVC